MKKLLILETQSVTPTNLFFEHEEILHWLTPRTLQHRTARWDFNQSLNCDVPRWLHTFHPSIHLLQLSSTPAKKERQVKTVNSSNNSRQYLGRGATAVRHFKVISDVHLLGWLIWNKTCVEENKIWQMSISTLTYTVIKHPFSKRKKTCKN